jgi:PHD/YefM family antitoxin component YafN of YafNO toxin-antitoxin module
MVDVNKKGPHRMLEVKNGRASHAQDDPTTAQYIDRMEREGRPITLHVDDRPPLVIADERAYQMLWELIDRIETIEGVREGLRQVEQGRTMPLDELDRRLRKKHGIRG